MKKYMNILLIFLLFSCLSSQTREPAVAGQWYPKDRAKLQKMMDSLFEDIDLEENGELNPFGLISPHAGFVYSGKVAAYGYSLLDGKKIDTVILLGPSHHYSNDIVSIYNGDFCKTPFGKIPIDKEISRELIKADKRFVFEPEIHAPEHSLEAQLPFLQYKLENFKVVLILTSTNDLSLLDKLAETIISIVEETDKKLLYINSSDMSHFHDYKTASEMDGHTINLILEKKWNKLNEEIFNRNCELCGYFAFYPFLKIMKHFNHDEAVLLKYANSGDVSGDTRRVVGYCSIVFPNSPKNSEDETMNEVDKKHLLKLARESISYYLEKGKMLKPVKPEKSELSEERAVFVTLNKNGNLRGCIGHMHARMPLYEAVVEMAVSSAFQDYRFGRVKKSEIDDIIIEISVLSPMQRIYDHEKIRMGTDGVWIKKGFQSGVYLPQVATETGWDRETFLRSLCSSKAGLPADAYKDPDTEIYIYQVEKFSE
nr:AmmeMemoRadiSam system protein B [Candidatus Cloacimonadota bacterium]